MILLRRLGRSYSLLQLQRVYTTNAGVYTTTSRVPETSEILIPPKKTRAPRKKADKPLVAVIDETKPAPQPRATRKKADKQPVADEETKPAPKPRVSRKKADEQLVAADETKPATKPRAPRKKVEKPPPPVIDEAQWRPSIIPLGKRVNKTQAQKLYRVSEDDLKDLPYDISDTTVAFQGTFHITLMYLYQERDVERAAWRKHGGPEGFEAHLQTLRTRWNNTPHKEPFLQPDYYFQLDSGPSVTAASIPPKPSPPKPSSSKPSPELIRIEESFPQKWLWTACMNFLEPSHDSSESPKSPEITSHRRSNKEKEKLLTFAVHELGPYPVRPESPLPPSNSISAFRSVLARAPATPDGKIMMMYTDGFTGENTFYWSRRYLDTLYESLIDVIQAHGTGEQGWEGIRWEIYDKYASCFGGIGRVDGRWVDRAKDWLRGCMPQHALTARSYEDSTVAELYNEMLPDVQF